MKLKCLPQDFQVFELTGLEPGSSGQFALYRLQKRGLGTPEAIDEIMRRWSIPRRRFAYAGLKDRHALTEQSITIRNGPATDLQLDNLQLRYLGQVARQIESTDIVANRFSITVRDIEPDQVGEVERRLREVCADGLPNYFDSQRFGSVSEAGQFVAAAWCRGDYQRALWLALAEPSRHDRAHEREQKRILREHWGNWPRCKELLARSHRRSIISYLADKPADFHGALARLRRELRGLHLAAFQSYIWNLLAAAVFRQHCRPEQLVEVQMRLLSLPFPTKLDDRQRQELASFELPLPSARTRAQLGPLATRADELLRPYGLTLAEMRIAYPRDSFFARARRRLWFKPQQLTWHWSDDELNPSKQALQLQFQLPRGAYATILIKGLFAAGAGS